MYLINTPSPVDGVPVVYVYHLSSSVSSLKDFGFEFCEQYAITMQREEKALEAALEALISRVTDLKSSIASFLLKLEHEHENINWPSMLDNFALMSGQMNTLLRVIKNDKTPPLRNLVVLPIQLFPDRDEELTKLTENRISVFNHDVVPDYLRTKPDPDVEQREQQVLQRANLVAPDAGQKQINSTNKIVHQMLDLVSSSREEWESEAGSRASSAQTSSLADTHLLISAVCLGKGLKTPQMKMPSAVPQGSQVQPPPQVPNLPKAPSTVKTNIKAAANIHPYAGR